MSAPPLPGAVRRLLRVALPPDWSDDIERDLEEAWQTHRAESGAARARLWLWGQTLAFCARFAPERVRDALAEPRPTSTDLKLALRSAARAPLLTALAVVSLGVGVGAALGAFTIVRGVTADLPYPGGERIVLVQDYDVRDRFALDVRAEEFLRRRDALSSFERFSAFVQRSVVVGEGPSAAVSLAFYATPGFLDMTEVSPMLGRLPDDRDVRPGAEPVVVLPHATWVRLTGADPDALGRRIELAGEPRTVIGVMPEGFAFPWSEGAWVPVDARDLDSPVRVVAKLRDGVDLATARAELAAVARPDPTQARPDALVRHLVTPVTRPMVDDRQIWVVALPVAVLVLLLLVMATNVANLVLARNAARAGELAVRGALGASRTRIVGQLAAEVALVVAVATAIGIGLSREGIGLVEARVDLPPWADFSMDPSAVLFGVALAGLVTFVAGVAPALRATRGDPADALRSGGRGRSDVRFGRLTGALVVVQVCVCVTFLSVATLLGQSLLRFGFEHYGIPGDETLVAQVYFGWPAELNDPGSDAAPEKRAALRSAFLGEATRKRGAIDARLLELPGVRRVTWASRFPGNESDKALVEAEGREEPPRPTEVADVAPGYFEILDAEVVAGRDFTAEEHAGRHAVALVNEPFVRDRLGGANPLGRRVRLLSEGDAGSGGGAEPGPWITIVGIVPDLGLNPGNPANAAAVYRPLPDVTVARVAVRVDGPLDGMSARLVDVVHEVDGAAQVQWTQTLAAQMREPATIFRAFGVGFLVLGTLALLLAAASLHALTACAVTRRTAEIGIRQALGAGSARIVGEVVRRSAIQLALGASTGSMLALGILRLARDFPWEVRQGSPLALLLVGGVLVLSGGLALARPLRRALAIRPAEAMRAE